MVKGKIKIKHPVRNKNYETGQFFDHILIEILEDEMLKIDVSTKINTIRDIVQTWKDYNW